MAGEDRTSRLKTTAYELVKQYVSYDGSDRTEYVYTAHTDAVHGTPCTVTQYEYVGASARVLKRKESNATWDSSWDI
jgi:hypothetical protein